MTLHILSLVYSGNQLRPLSRVMTFVCYCQTLKIFGVLLPQDTKQDSFVMSEEYSFVISGHLWNEGDSES